MLPIPLRVALVLNVGVDAACAFPIPDNIAAVDVTMDALPSNSPEAAPPPPAGLPKNNLYPI